MYFSLDEAEHVKKSEFILQFLEETKSFFKEKGADIIITDNAFSRQISFENNKFSFKLSVSIPLRK